ncbi:hypothetical protein [Vannielia sp. SX4]|uniref:hypothetical protein n=1 Tax=Vannielia sp. SX4 TaxID=3463852 RepID=UPI00405A27BF
MRKLGFAAIAGLAVLAAGCAKQPEAVAAAKIDHRPYKAYSCSTLSQMQAKGEIAVEQLSAKQSAAASNDAFGVFMLGLPVASMAGNDPEAQLSIAKGQLNAIKLARSEKRCR